MIEQFAFFCATCTKKIHFIVQNHESIIYVLIISNKSDIIYKYMKIKLNKI